MVNICKPGISLPSSPKEIALIAQEVQELWFECISMWIQIHNSWMQAMHPISWTEEIDLGSKLPAMLAPEWISSIMGHTFNQVKKFLP